ncbi:hypothetical protein BP6252_05390 [Coleophoma cylindrospora]|uniref:Uncharacterized protein n=1 Tax=Coleophoma cylindrospora TaxID=1849047 RepID=A0A3D8RTB4_9HELO|nr:hypothetical protein BP6252_05390 [Coleophoma cylindrospora]
MRYQDWDVLIFPDESKAPLQEFKTACQVVHDSECCLFPNQEPLLPTVTSFISALAEGEPFRVSIHCWTDPEPSRLLQSITKYAEQAIFEARVFIDGNLVRYDHGLSILRMSLINPKSTKYFNRTGNWPSILDLSNVIDKNGDFDKLKFPAFHQELLSQNFWHPGDDLGRIKVVVAEGFARASATNPFDRIKNIVAFSFQHAPRNVLEASSIAWPNTAMWHRFPSPTLHNVQHMPPPYLGGGTELHAHSPRRTKQAPLFEAFPALAPTTFVRQPSESSLSSMTRANTRNPSRQFTNPNMLQDGQQQTLQSAGAFESVCAALLPAANGQNVVEGVTGSSAPLSRRVSNECSPSSPGMKSKREDLQNSSISNGEENETVTHKFAQNFSRISSTSSKRKRKSSTVKAVESTEDLSTSPTLRKVPRGTIGRAEGGRRALSGIENV